MAVNNFMHLVGDYHSDSENEDSQSKPKHTNTVVTNWTQCTDASTGHPYYWNIVTKEVTWEIPDDYKEFLDRANDLNPNNAIEWMLCQTEDNTPYYFNESTREISWDKPDGFVEATQQNHVENKNPKIEQPKNKFNLVPEYNSDDSDDESAKPSQEKPLFPSSISSSDSTSNQITKTWNRPEQPAEENRTLSPPATKSSSESLPHKVKPSFASIITGGRSPQSETDIQTFIGENHDETIEPTETTVNANEPEILPQKTFQRKRRIEFKTTAPAKRSNQNEEPETNTEPAESTTISTRSKYNNFQKGESELSETAPATTSNHRDDDENGKANGEIVDQQYLLEAKLNFLCQGRADVSPVQVIQIQLQALQAAHTAEALHSDYLLEWMKNISNDLIKLESDAAPSGWKCLWNREKEQYCYENTETGEIQWEYPDLEQPSMQENNVLDDDEMDISTTPPPNEAAFYPANEFNEQAAVPPPPTWSDELAESAKNQPINEKPMDDELASFYSDIAQLEPTDDANNENSDDKTPPDSETVTQPDNDNGESGGGDDKKKKKKKKTKKLEPWRSGNLETWINKWQKAQKELDG